MNDKTTNDYPDEPVCELWLCETQVLGLKPNQIYLFRVDPNCETCKKVAAENELSGTTK